MRPFRPKLAFADGATFSIKHSSRGPAILRGLAAFVGLSLSSASAVAETYWVDDDGAAEWSSCSGTTPLAGALACPLSTANASAIAGDVIILRGGTYNTQIAPAQSGTAGNTITYQAQPTETPLITNVGNVAAIYLNGNDYIRIDGITVQNVYRLATITGGSDYNEIANSTLSDAESTGNGGLGIYTTAVTPATANTHNWIHDNTIFGASFITDHPDCNDQSNLMKVGSSNEDGYSGHNTVENNHLYWGGHHVLQISSQYNVIRNNVMHNEGHIAAPSGCEAGYCPDPATNQYGNRVMTVVNYGSDDYPVPSEMESYVLVENNRLGHAGLPSDDNGADVLTIGASNTIARHNFIYNGRSTGVYFRSSANPADDIHFYNNTLYGNGIDTPCRDTWPAWIEKGIRIQADSDRNALTNNIAYLSSQEDIDCQGTCTSVLHNNWVTTDGDPSFVDPDVSDPMSLTLPDLALQEGSGAIDGGTHLTTVAASDTGSGTALVVEDPWFFQDGSWGSSLSDVRADWIAVGTVSNTVEIQAIDYGTNTITLATEVTRAADDPVWLYRDSAGRIVLIGDAPDYGAAEFGQGEGGGGAGGAAAGGSGTAGAGGGTGATGGGTVTTPPASSPSDDGGCGCRIDRSHQARAGWTALLLIGLGLARRSRRRSQRQA